MRYKKSKRWSLRKNENSNARRGLRRRFLFESLESRVVLTGTPTLVDLNPFDASEPSDFTPVGDLTFFVADDGSNGRELWVTDGTASGTRLVKDIAPGSTYQSNSGYVPNSSSPRELVEFNGELFFVADDGVNGQELWKTDGTNAGTVMVRDINPGSGEQDPYPYGPLQSFPRDPVEFNGRLFISAEDSTNGAELWATDGTNAGTFLVRDIFPGSTSDSYGTIANSSNVQDLVNVNGSLYFTADDGTNGRELWRSDGTASGTVMVKDLFSGTYPYYRNNYYYGLYPNASNARKLTAAGGLLYFIAKDANGLELWRSDGTEAGTFMLRDIRAGSDDAFTDNSSLIGVGNTLFFTANDGLVGDELWKSDGTTSGTVLVKDIDEGSGGNLSNYTGFADVNGMLFFSAKDGLAGRELWKSDGTEAGTVLVKDINPSVDNYGTPYNSYPLYMANFDGTLYFSAQSAGTGRELWQSDGTETGTVMVADTVAGSSGIYPNNLEVAGDTLVFSGNNGGGRELYTLVPEAEATTNTGRVTIFVGSQPVAIPANIGVKSDGSMEAVFTDASNGEVKSDIGSTVTLGDFFDIWRTNAGLAGNNANAILSDTQLLSNVEGGTNTVQMFVNGQVSEQYGDYVLRNGDEIVLVYGDNPVISLNTNFGAIVIELFETETPGTVDNFLNYVNDGDYVNSFFHRSVSNFVIQGGGFTTSSTTFSSTSQFTSVPSDVAIQNEPGISNLRTTIAMAKTSDPNSATSQFFVNLSDDNTFLDDSSNSGGFTVFGQVLDMTTSDEIAALPINNVDGSLYAELPISTSSQLAVVQSVTGQGEITGVKFSDDNANGVKDSGEATIAGVSIFIDADNDGILDPGETTTTTASDGRYLLQVEAGTHTVRSQLSSGKITTIPSTGSYSVTVEIGRESSGRDFGAGDLPSPSGVELLTSSDSGTSTADNLTRFNNADGATLQFEVSGVTPGAEVKLFGDGTQIGTATASSTSVIVIMDGEMSLPDGSHSIIATQAVSGGESAASNALTITIDTVAPAAPATTAPDIAQFDQIYSFDADSPDEGTTGIVYSLTNAPSGMTIDSASGLVTWAPSVSQAVPQSFAIVVSDSAGNMVSQGVELTVLGVIPAFPEAYTVAEDSSLAVDAANGVLANDGDSDSGTLTASVVTQPTHGSFSFNSDGSFTYTPNVDFFGEDSFTYSATDGVDESNVAKVTIHVTGVNDATVPSADTYTTSEDIPLTVDAAQGVLANDADVDGDVLAATISAQAGNGSVSLAADGSFTYTPNGNFSGSDSFTYTVNDGTVTSSPINVNLTVTDLPDPPTAIADSYSVNEDNAITIDAASGVLTNDSDPDSTSLTAIINSQPANGSLSLNSDGSFTYTPNTNFFGGDSFSYIASDGSNLSAAATVTITVNAQPDSPTANDDTVTATPDGGAVTIDVLGNDSSEPDDPQSISISTVTQGSSGGSIAINGTTVSYAPPAGFSGTETFSYTIQDSDGLTDSATVTVTVSAAANNSISGFVYLDSNGNGTRDSDDWGVPGVQITLTGTDSGGNSINSAILTTNDGFYSFNDLPTGTYSLSERQPSALSDGSDSMNIASATAGNDNVTSFSLSGGQSFTENNFGEAALLPQYASVVFRFASTNRARTFRDTIAFAEEMLGNSSLADAIRVGGTEVPERIAPVAIGDAYSVDSDTVLTVDAATGVLANDTDADGDALTAQLAASPTNGLLTLNTDGSFTYTPNSGFSGSDSFRYTASDGEFTSSVATVTITVNGENAAPVATVDSYSVNEDQTLAISSSSGVLLNDSDADGDSLTAVIVTSTTNGSISLASDGSFTYTASENFNGTDTFTYQASDGSLLSATISVTITVHSVNDHPVAADNSFSVSEDHTLTIAAVSGVLANDSDVDGDALTAQVAVSPANGTLTLNSDGSLTYTPNANFNGTETFTYLSSDGDGGSDQANATINVTAVNDAPVGIADSYSTNEDTVVAIDAVMGVLGNDTDVDGDTLSAVLSDPPDHGTLTLNPDGSLTYSPDADFNGTDVFSYVANDGLDDSLITQVAISVLTVEDPPALQLPAEFTDPAIVASRTLGQTIDFTVSVQDPDDSDYSFQVDLELSGIPDGEAVPTIDLTTGRFLWMPTVTGRFEIRIITVNGDGEADQETILIDILPA